MPTMLLSMFKKIHCLLIAALFKTVFLGVIVDVFFPKLYRFCFKVGFPQKMRLKKYDPVKLSISIFIFMVFIQLI